MALIPIRFNRDFVASIAAIGLMGAFFGDVVQAQTANKDVYETCGHSFSGWIRVNGILHCLYNSDEPGWTQSVIPGKNPVDRSKASLVNANSSSGYYRPSRSLPFPPGYSSSDTVNRAPAVSTSGSSVQSGINQYGPRGGCYQINSKGNKDYGKC